MHTDKYSLTVFKSLHWLLHHWANHLQLCSVRRQQRSYGHCISRWQNRHWGYPNVPDSTSFHRLDKSERPSLQQRCRQDRSVRQLGAVTLHNLFWVWELSGLCKVVAVSTAEGMCPLQQATVQSLCLKIRAHFECASDQAQGDSACSTQSSQKSEHLRRNAQSMTSLSLVPELVIKLSAKSVCRPVT